MILLGMVYPYFWAMNGKEVEKKLHIHLNVLRVTFNVPCKVISESIYFFLTLFSNQANISNLIKAKMQI